MSKAKELIESLAALLESNTVSDSKKHVLSQALNNPHGIVSFKTRVRNGIRRGGRHAQAASDLHSQGHLRHVSTERDSEMTKSRTSTSQHVISTYTLTDTGRELANKHKQEEK